MFFNPFAINIMAQTLSKARFIILYKIIKIPAHFNCTGVFFRSPLGGGDDKWVRDFRD